MIDKDIQVSAGSTIYIARHGKYTNRLVLLGSNNSGIILYDTNRELAVCIIFITKLKISENFLVLTY